MALNEKKIAESLKLMSTNFEKIAFEKVKALETDMDLKLKGFSERLIAIGNTIDGKQTQHEQTFLANFNEIKSLVTAKITDLDLNFTSHDERLSHMQQQVLDIG